MTNVNFNSKYYLNVGKLMKEKTLPKPRLKRPRLKRTVLVTGWNEFLHIIEVEAEV